MSRVGTFMLNHLPFFASFFLYPLLAAFLNWVLWWDSPANWDAFVEAHPGRARLVRFLRSLNPHFRKVVELWRDYAASRSVVPVKPLQPVQPEPDVPPVTTDVPPSDPVA